MTWAKALISWLILFVIAFANGAFRSLYYVRFLGEQRANQVSCGTGILAFGIAIWLLSRRWRFASNAQAWRTGLLWLGLTIGWEFVFGHYVMGHPWERLLHDYAIWEGRLWVLVLAFVLVAPVLVRWADGILDKSN
jgi:hypothetical protein